VPALAQSQSPVSFDVRPAGRHYTHFHSQWRAAGSWKLGECGEAELTTKASRTGENLAKMGVESDGLTQNLPVSQEYGLRSGNIG